MRRGLFAIAFAVVLGCGGDGVDIDADQDNVCSEVAKVACHNLYQCCSEGEIERFLGVSEPRTELECESDVQRLCKRSIASLDFAIDERRVRFDSKVMNSCLDALVAPSGTCATVATELPWAEDCMNSAWVGLVDNGGTCLSAFECASKDSFCNVNQLCTAKPTDGQLCGGFGCATGLYCNAGTCRPQLGAGGQCTSTVQCQQDLFCDLATAPSVCSPLRGPGQACTGNASCEAGQCNPGTCAGTAQTCFADASCSGRCADDQSVCFSDSACSNGACSVSAAFCTATAQCPVGETCNFPVRCLPGDCVGDIVCADRHLVVDYCEDALGALPIPN